MQVVQIADVPSQIVQASLGSQQCTIVLRTRTIGLYLDLYVNDVLLVGGVACQNENPMVRTAYAGFQGELCFLDNQGSDDPSSPGLGTRFTLVYIEPQDMP